MLKPEDVLRAIAAARGDAVCVPAIEWLARHYLLPAVVRARGGLAVGAVAL